jgi:hypothetical protein
MIKSKVGGAARDSELSLEELREQIMKSNSLMDLYRTKAHSEIKTPADLENVQYEMKAIQKQILSSLSFSKTIIKKLQREVNLE